MERLSVSHQTLKEFLEEPFGTKNKTKNYQYEQRYQSYKKSNKIKIESTIEFEKHYFVHVQVPSESQKGLSYYDVVVEFAPPNEKVEKELTVQNYYVQFFSNSPGFVYKYAALYKMQGYLIETLYDKFSDGILDILPEKANKNFELYYDSSIYYACKFLLDNKILYLGKLNLKVFKTKPFKNFFFDIQDIESVNISRNVNALETQMKREIQKDDKLTHQQEQTLKRNQFIGKEIFKKRDAQRRAKKSTFKDKAKESKIKMATSRTSDKSSIKVNRGTQKKRASKSTRKPT